MGEKISEIRIYSLEEGYTVYVSDSTGHSIGTRACSDEKDLIEMLCKILGVKQET